ncbi:hypothetical protein ACQEVY_16980 [Streptomyces sp. CA-288835]|uniref:hypothetical protein n=1 Tax=Streptomyces sp. CA-288835 TaxID=3240069 RepID=UPI003D8BC89A
MADEQYKWLDRSAAERLLRGEPLESVGADDRDQADRLVRALGALTAELPPTSAELPGEANALAAFRKARTVRDEEHATFGHRHTASSADAGLVRLDRASADRRGRSRLARPLRYGLAATLAAGMLGGAAVATPGVLPFTDDDPEPGATVTAPEKPRRPLITPSPGKTGGGAPAVPEPDGDAGAPTGDGSPSAPGTDDRPEKTPRNTTPQPGGGDAGNEARSQDWWKKVTADCRDVRDGKKLAPDRRRSLEDAASGPERVQQYCTNVLKQSEAHDDAPQGNGQGSDDDGDDSDDGDHPGGDKKKGKGGKGGKDGKGNDDEPGDITPTYFTPTGDAPTRDVRRRAIPARTSTSVQVTTPGGETWTLASAGGTAPRSFTPSWP